VARLFDVPVGFFRASGFHHLHEALESVEKIPILVGLNVDWLTFEIVYSHRRLTGFDFESHQQTRENFSDNVSKELELSPDSYDVGTLRQLRYVNYVT